MPYHYTKRRCAGCGRTSPIRPTARPDTISAHIGGSAFTATASPDPPWGRVATPSARGRPRSLVTAVNRSYVENDHSLALGDSSCLGRRTGPATEPLVVREPGRQRYPRSRALSTARVRSRTPSFERMLEVWFFTVPSAVPRASAISRLL